MKLVPIGLHQHEVIVVPTACVPKCISLAHEPGHNGVNRTYQAMRRKFYMPHMKKRVADYVANCTTCAKVNKVPYRLPEVHSTVPKAPMDFIAMDLIGNFPPSTSDNVYALTAIDMLTSFVWAIPIPNKTAETIVAAFLKHIHKFGMPRKILTDNGTEFVNQLFRRVATELGTEHLITTPAYHPQSNGKLEGFHYFLKTCATKMLGNDMEWDQVLPLAANTYNFFPSEAAKESPFFLMFGRDPRLRLHEFLRPRIRYLGDSEGLKRLDILHACHWLAIQNIKRSRLATNKPNSPTPQTPFAVGDLVFVKDHVAKSFDLRYRDPLRVLKVYKTQLQVIDQKGNTHTVHITDCKRVPMSKALLDETPDLSQYRLKKYCVDPTTLPFPPDVSIQSLSDILSVAL